MQGGASLPLLPSVATLGTGSHQAWATFFRCSGAVTHAPCYLPPVLGSLASVPSRAREAVLLAHEPLGQRGTRSQTGAPMCLWSAAGQAGALLIRAALSPIRGSAGCGGSGWRSLDSYALLRAIPDPSAGQPVLVPVALPMFQESRSPPGCLGLGLELVPHPFHHSTSQDQPGCRGGESPISRWEALHSPRKGRACRDGDARRPFL